MDTDKKLGFEEKSDGEMAAQVEEEARRERDEWVYEHEFRKPFTYQGRSYEKLTFDWGALTGADHLEIENELLRRGKTLVSPEFTGDFLAAMAARACVDRREDGFRVLSVDMLKAMPLRDFQTICRRARGFLLRAES